jgi:hypothetical protein
MTHLALPRAEHFFCWGKSGGGSHAASGNSEVATYVTSRINIFHFLTLKYFHIRFNLYLASFFNSVLYNY